MCGHQFPSQEMQSLLGMPPDRRGFIGRWAGDLRQGGRYGRPLASACKGSTVRSIFRQNATTG